MNPLVRLSRGPGEVVVVLRPYPWWRVVAVLAAMTVGCAATLWLLGGTTDSAAGQVALTFGVETVGGFCVATLLAVGWYSVGRQIVTATRVTLTIDHRLLLLRFRRQAYQARSIRNLRATPAGQVIADGRPVKTVAALAFDYNGQTVRFGAGLAGTSAEDVLSVLREGLASGTARS